MSAVIVPFARRETSDRRDCVAAAAPCQQLAPVITPCLDGLDREARIDRMAELIVERAERKRAAKEPRASRKHFNHLTAGTDSGLAVAFRIAAWAQSARALPSIKAFMDRWGMSRATAYSYRQKLIESGLVSTSKGRQ